MEGTERPVEEERPESMPVIELGESNQMNEWQSVSCAICYTHL